MVLVEFREAAINKAWDALEEAKDYGKRVKIALCSLEDALCEVYEASEEEEYDDTAKYDTEVSGNDIDINYRRRSGMRNHMMRSGYRGMRMRDHSNRYSY